MESIPEKKRILQPWWALVGVGLLLVGLYFLIYDIPKWNVLWYAFGWYGYLLIVDAIIYLRQGRSFLTHRRRELLEMMFWSVPFWFLFEAYNFVIKNWYYVFALRSDWLQGVFAWMSFATVLPACFVHAELLKSLGLFSGLRIRPMNIYRGLRQLFLYFGAACIFFPVILPRYAFWMVWGATLGVPDVINYYNGAPSILGDLEEGRPGRLYRLLIGGMIAGLVWEGLNYWARCKWIYTVPGLESVKLFEMPIPGFLGFPVLAVEAFAFYSLLSHFLRGGRNWDQDDFKQVGRRLARSYFPAAGLAVIFSVISFIGVMHITLQSRRPLLRELNGITTREIGALHDAHIHSPEQFFDQAIPSRMVSLGKKTGIPVEKLDDFRKELSLALHKGMGIPDAKMLMAVGVEQVTDLLIWNANDLYQALADYAATHNLDPPGKAEVKVWLRAVELVGRTKR